MQQTSPHESGPFAELLARIPFHDALDQMAFDHKALLRKRKIDSGATLLRLALARGPGGLSLRDTAGWAAMMNVADITNPGLKYRLNQSASFLSAIMERLLEARAASDGLRWRGRTLSLTDGSCVTRPGSQGTDWRVHATFDLERGGFSHLQLTDGKGAEALTRDTTAPGEVRIADRGYCKAPALARFRRDSGMTADFIVRAPWDGFSLTSDGTAFHLIDALEAMPAERMIGEVNAQAYVNKDENLPLRFIILRKPEKAAAETRAKLHAHASRKQKTLDPRTLIAAGFVVLATSLPVDYPAEEVLAVYRLRWQIELAFKRLKSLIHIDKLPCVTERGARPWLYAHLILALLCDDLSQDFLESFPSGPF